MLRAPFVAVGLWYAISSLSANYLIAVGKSENDPRHALAEFHLAADVFPLKSSFRVMPAYYLIYVVHRGMDDLREIAITEVEKTLRSNPNSDYLKAHLERLKR